jgi:hypothetical protein
MKEVIIDIAEFSRALNNCYCESTEEIGLN